MSNFLIAQKKLIMIIVAFQHIILKQLIFNHTSDYKTHTTILDSRYKHRIKIKFIRILIETFRVMSVRMMEFSLLLLSPNSCNKKRSEV